MNKFRIPFSDVIVVPDMTSPPSLQTKAWFDAMTQPLVRRDDDDELDESTG